jgi:hypothetical protein
VTGGCTGIRIPENPGQFLADQAGVVGISHIHRHFGSQQVDDGIVESQKGPVGSFGIVDDLRHRAIEQDSRSDPNA